MSPDPGSGWVRAYLGLGSNLGDRSENLRRAVALLGARDGVAVVRTSSVYETAPVGPSQPDFLNAVAEVDTTLSPRDLLEACLGVEEEMGRVRRERWGPRVIDVDLLLYGDERVDEPDLVVPHPRMHERAFVLVPLAELAPDVVLPDGRTIGEAARAGGEDLTRGAGAAGPLEGTGTTIAGDVSEETGSTTVAIIGAGRVGTALGVLLERAGHRVVAASGRDASRERVATFLPNTAFADAHDAARGAAVVIVAVPDDHIAPMVDALAASGALRAGQAVIHVSGSTSLRALDAAQQVGASVLALHPLQSFPDVQTGIDRLAGSGVAVTAATEDDAAFGERLVRDIGATPFRLDDEVKPLYHAAAVFAANYLVTVEALAERIMRAAGVTEPLPLLRALARTSFDRTFAIGPGAALTGPAVRGDVGTIDRNLRALASHAPEASGPYVALGLAAAGLAAAAGRLPPEEHRRVEEALRAWM
jgi:2-amino-4-hydroxy-6-hydroxymethyldihydropteridine diphosphokinase